MLGYCLDIGYWLLAIKNQSVSLYTSVIQQLHSQGGYTAKFLKLLYSELFQWPLRKSIYLFGQYGSRMQIADLDISADIIEIFEREGITELYPPQAEALPKALEGKNIVLAIPTASGKTLVAYIAILKKILAGGKALYIVPLRALAREKYDELKQFESLGIRVGMSVGDYDSSGRELDSYDVLIATSEKADSLLRHRTHWLNSISIIGGRPLKLFSLCSSRSIPAHRSLPCRRQ